MRNIHIIGAAFGWGGRRHGAEDAPDYLKQNGFTARLETAGISCEWECTVYPSVSYKNHPHVSREESFPFVTDYTARLCDTVTRSIKHEQHPVVIGGDHAIAMATWSAVTSELSNEGEFGLIWIDAHMDAHTPETANEGAWGGYYHGRPVATLLGYGEGELTKLGSDKPKLNPKHVVMIGIRSYESGEAELLRKLGVQIYYMDDIHRYGIKSVIQKATKRIINNTKNFGISIDLDGFDPVFAPGVATRESEGLHANEVLDAMTGLGNHPQCRALEIAEYNPNRDTLHKTENLIKDIIVALYKEK